MREKIGLSNPVVSSFQLCVSQRSSATLRFYRFTAHLPPRRRGTQRYAEKISKVSHYPNPADFAEGEKLAEALSGLLDQGFIEVDGAKVFAAMRNIGEDVKPKNFPDLTGFECFVNHIHVEDQLEHPVSSEIVVAKQGIAFALKTATRLRSTFPKQSFKVIVASTAQGRGVRFYLKRPGEEWLARDLDSYAEEAILVLDTH